MFEVVEFKTYECIIAICDHLSLSQHLHSLVCSDFCLLSFISSSLDIIVQDNVIKCFLAICLGSRDKIISSNFDILYGGYVGQVSDSVFIACDLGAASMEVVNTAG